MRKRRSKESGLRPARTFHVRTEQDDTVRVMGAADAQFNETLSDEASFIRGFAERAIQRPTQPGESVDRYIQKLDKVSGFSPIESIDHAFVQGQLQDATESSKAAVCSRRSTK